MGQKTLQRRIYQRQLLAVQQGNNPMQEKEKFIRFKRANKILYTIKKIHTAMAPFLWER